jgi:hypothetical protein
LRIPADFTHDVFFRENRSYANQQFFDGGSGGDGRCRDQRSHQTQSHLGSRKDESIDPG